MNKRILLAGVMAVSIAMTACNNVKKDEKQKTSASDTEVSETTLESETSEAKTTTSEAESTEKKTEDPYAKYADDSFQVPSIILGHLSALTSWSTTIEINCKNHTFKGEYESAVFKIDGDAYDAERCRFSGMIDTFTRVNEYSFSTHVKEFSTEKFEATKETYQDLPADVTYADPYGFTKADELILYLPNTPVSVLPQELVEWVEMYQNIDPNGHLDSYILYNPADYAAFQVRNPEQ